MSTFYSLAEAIQRAAEMKKTYDENLNGKTFLYVYLKNNILTAESVQFKESNYLHLTGLDYKNAKTHFLKTGERIPTHALEFYHGLEKINSPKSIANDISFATTLSTEETQRIYNQTQNKLNNLSKLVQIAKKAEFIGIYSGRQQFDLIVNRSTCSLAVKNINGENYPISLLNGNVEQHTYTASKIVAIFVKDNSKSQYIIQYLNKKVNIDKSLFDNDLCEKLSISSFNNEKVRFNNSQLESIIKSFNISVKRSLSNKISILAKKRLLANQFDDKINDYDQHIKRFINQLESSEYCDIAIELLNIEKEKIADSQESNIPAEITNDVISCINEEIGAISKRKKQLYDNMGESNIINFNTIDLANRNYFITSNGTISAAKPIEIPIPPTPSFKQLLRKMSIAIKKFFVPEPPKDKPVPKRTSRPTNDKSLQNKSRTSATNSAEGRHQIKKTESAKKDNPPAVAAFAPIAPAKKKPPMSMGDIIKKKNAELKKEYKPPAQKKVKGKGKPSL